MTIFEFKSHIDYMRFRLQSVRGSKSKFAEFLRIQPAYLSQILAEKLCLNLEQADLANQFFDHAHDEKDFFFLLVLKDRAGSKSLRQHFEGQMDAAVKKRLSSSERLGLRKSLPEEIKGIYYSSWIYSAVDLACTIPSLRTRNALVERLNLPTEVISRVLDFLTENGILKKDGEEYFPTELWIRLDKASPHIVKHHANWRTKAIQNLEVRTDEDLHYSGLFSLDKKTAMRIKDRCLEFIKEQVKEIETAKEEDLFVFEIDLFNLK
jgi:hypothetical protein